MTRCALQARRRWFEPTCTHKRVINVSLQIARNCMVPALRHAEADDLARRNVPHRSAGPFRGMRFNQEEFADVYARRCSPVPVRRYMEKVATWW